MTTTTDYRDTTDAIRYLVYHPDADTETLMALYDLDRQQADELVSSERARQMETTTTAA